MIGIRNADGTLSWLMSPKPGSRKTVSLSPVRHGQRKVRFQLVFRNNQDEERTIGILQFSTNLDGFLERPEMETQLRIDARGRLYIAVDVQGKTVQKRFVIPGFRADKAKSIPGPVSPPKKKQGLARRALPWPTIFFFTLGTLAFAVAAWLWFGGKM